MSCQRAFTRFRASIRRPGKLSCVSACSPATARAIPKQSVATGTTDEPRGTGPTSLSAGDATLVRHEADRRGRAPLLRFVPLQHSPAAARPVRWMPTIRTIPLRRFRRRPARYRRSAEKSTASARAVLRPRQCELASSDVADVRVVFLRRSQFPPHKWGGLAFAKISTFDTSLITVAGVDPMVDALAVTRSTSIGAGSRLPVRGRVIRRGRFSHAVFRTRFRSPGSAAWPGGLGSSLLPSGGAPGVAPFAGLLPIGGWTRGVNPAAKWMRAFDRPSSDATRAMRLSAIAVRLF